MVPFTLSWRGAVFQAGIVSAGKVFGLRESELCSARGNQNQNQTLVESCRELYYTEICKTERGDRKKTPLPLHIIYTFTDRKKTETRGN